MNVPSLRSIRMHQVICIRSDWGCLWMPPQSHPRLETWEHSQMPLVLNRTRGVHEHPPFASQIRGCGVFTNTSSLKTDSGDLWTPPPQSQVNTDTSRNLYHIRLGGVCESSHFSFSSKICDWRALANTPQLSFQIWDLGEFVNTPSLKLDSGTFVMYREICIKSDWMISVNAPQSHLRLETEAFANVLPVPKSGWEAFVNPSLSSIRIHQAICTKSELMLFTNVPQSHIIFKTGDIFKFHPISNKTVGCSWQPLSRKSMVLQSNRFQDFLVLR